MSPTLLVILVLAGAAIAVFAMLWVRRLEQRRSEEIREIGTTLGLVPADEGGELPEVASRFPLMNVGHSRKANNILTGSIDRTPVIVFDYRYTTGGGRSSQTHRFTVAVFSEAARALSDFELAPEGLAAKVGQMFGYQDIDFMQDTEFSSKYLLRGADEDAIRAVFGDGLRGLLRESLGWCMQARGGAVAVYRREGRWKTQDFGARLTEACRLVGALGS